MDKLDVSEFTFVFENLSKSDLRAASAVYRQLHALCIPVLWRTIDFTWPEITNFIAPYGFPRSELHQAQQCKVVSQQELWMEEVLRTPDCSKHVRSLSWKLEIGNFTSDVYGVFKLLANVREVCISSRWRSTSPVPDVPKDTYFFPKANNVTLRGPLPPKFTSAILGGPGKQT